VVTGSNLTYPVTVSNGGPNTASSVMLANQFSADVTVVSLLPTQGTATNSNNAVACSFGPLTNAAVAAVQIVVTAPPGSSLTNLVSAGSLSRDSNSTNNAASAVTTITSP
jgi:uncharacterized repeat protein (TIGR01451 family)